MSLIFVILFAIIDLCFSYEICELSKHLGTKTAYREVENKDIKQITYEGCKPLKIWMIIRHGTRLPSKNLIYEMNKRLPKLRDDLITKNSKSYDAEINENELNYIRNWNVSIEEADEKILAHEGEDEMINLAERMQLRFPDLFSKVYSNTSYKFKYTATQRTEQSAYYFATGLFGRQTAKHVWYPEPLHSDPILRFYKLCDKWRKEIKKNPLAAKERLLFINGTLMQQTLRSICHRLGFETGKLTYNDVYTMYMTCAFESSWTKRHLSPWCKAFTCETIQTLEYAEDLKYYWIDGYGYNLTYEQACPAIKNLVDFFKSKEAYPKVVLYFTHSGTILKLLAHLGLYKDSSPLKHDNYLKFAKRLWRVSKIDAFGSNIAIVLFKCGQKEKVLLLHQERVVQLPNCLGSDLCDFNIFLKTYKTSINNCNFEEMCRL